ncbi:hypothetical protein ABZ404_39070 [Streptomyces sp. NPDC005878]|uniref:hypothetical protein n=1 Tax=Streptomyces sp. NPDC005878 TaxID=3157077 RepID=UPI0033D05913
MLNGKQREPATHDFGPGRRYWGHDYCISTVTSSGQRIRLSGWGHDGLLIEEGDYLLLDKKNGRSTRYRVEEIERVMEPDDMWHATLVFAPRVYHPLAPEA